MPDQVFWTDDRRLDQYPELFHKRDTCSKKVLVKSEGYFFFAAAFLAGFFAAAFFAAAFFAAAMWIPPPTRKG